MQTIMFVIRKTKSRFLERKLQTVEKPIFATGKTKFSPKVSLKPFHRLAGVWGQRPQGLYACKRVFEGVLNVQWTFAQHRPKRSRDFGGTFHKWKKFPQELLTCNKNHFFDKLILLLSWKKQNLSNFLFYPYFLIK